MKKLSLCLLIFSFVHQMVPENESNGVLTKIKEVIHSKNTLFSIGKYSISQGKAIVGVLGLAALFILLKNLEKILRLKLYFLTKNRQKKLSRFIIEPSWVYPDYVKNKYSQEVEKKLLKCREQLWQGYKNLLEQFREDMNIDNQKFVEYLITDMEEENYLEKGYGRTRFIDQSIPKEIQNFIDKWLSEININPNNIDLCVEKLKKKGNLETRGKTRSKLSLIKGERIGEAIDIDSSMLNRHLKSLTQLDDAINKFTQAKEDDKKLNEEIKELKTELLRSTSYTFLLNYEIFGILLHEIAHISMHHNLTFRLLMAEKSSKFKNNLPEDLTNEIKQYQEFMAESLLSLLYPEAAKIMLKEYITQAICKKYHKKSIYFNEFTKSFHMSQKSLFVLHTDIVRLYGITLEDCMNECFNEMKILISKQEFDSIYRNLHGIYKSANPEFYVQKHTNDEFKFPRFLPHFLEKQFPEDVAIKK